MARTGVSMLTATQSTQRVLRHPRHSFNVRHRPFEITPFMIAPVLPGETLKNLLIQCRCVTDPIKNKLGGWWLEHYFFYIKHRDLDERDTLTAMMLDPSTSVAALRLAAQDVWKYVADDDIDWTQMCLKRVVEEFFREEGVTWNQFVITAGRPAATIVGDSWMESAVDRTTFLDPADITLVNEAGAGTLTASELDRQMRQWEFLRANDFTNQTYEEWLATYGVRPATVELHKPELIRYLRDWKYPSNAVDPTDGSVASAVSWAVSERADKDRFFKEPGFVFGVTLARPKVYLKNQSGAAVGFLDDAYAWLPAIMKDDPATSLKEIAANNGPLQATTNPYVTDVRDLFLYGDQFVNFALTDAEASIVDLPNAAMTNKRYPASADADALFRAASPANQVRQDGVVSMSILGTQVDYT